MKTTARQHTQQHVVKTEPGPNRRERIMRVLMARLRVRDAETQGHSERVARFSLRLGRELGLQRALMKSLEYGALLHDIGKIEVPDEILRKPGSLTPLEWITMRQHPLIGSQMLQDIDFLKEASLVVAQHHERWDGQGYPFGLRAMEINRNARIFAVADALDAITSVRVYHSGKNIETAAAELNRCAGRQFDPEVIRAFNRIPLEAWK